MSDTQEIVMNLEKNIKIKTDEIQKISQELEIKKSMLDNDLNSLKRILNDARQYYEETYGNRNDARNRASHIDEAQENAKK